MDADFYHLFYDPDIRPEILVFEIAVNKEEVVLTLNHGTVLRARLDGHWQSGDAKTVMPPLCKYAVTARFADENTLQVSLRWLNSWYCPEITFELSGDSGLAIRCEKDLLHNGRTPFT